MRRAGDKLREGSGGTPARGLALAAALVGLAWLAPLRAQESWMPTVATSPGGTLNAPTSGHVGLTPPMIDPRFFPSPAEAAQAQAQAEAARKGPPRGAAWSPIVTGAIPAGRETVVPGAYVPPVEKRETLSPIRPLQPALAQAAGAKAAAGEAAPKAEAVPEAAAATEGDAADPMFKAPGPLDALPPDATAAQQYCFNTADSAADARFAWQARKIKEMEAALDKRSQQLEAKTQQYKTWLARRDEFSRKAHDKLVGFYSRMRPDAAALQLASLDEEMAAAVVTKLETKVASQIMGEMDPEQAAKIAAIISGAARVPPERRRAAPAREPEAVPGDTTDAAPVPDGGPPS